MASRRISLLPALVLAAALIACGGSSGVSPTAPVAAELAAAPDATPVAPPSDELVPFASEESMRRLERARHKVDFFSLANHYEGQQNGGMCGPATAVIVLNTLRADAPEDTKPVDRSLFPAEYLARLPPHMKPLFHRYGQGIFFDDARVAAVKSKDRFHGGVAGPDQKPDPGMQLRQLHEIFLALGADSTIRVLDESWDDERARAEMIEILGRPGDYLVINYTRVPLGQEGGGHISPVAAYDEASDSFLVMDVNPNRGKTWAWVPAGRLLGAMRTFDTIENRGYLLVRDRPAR
jgi:hypothetical protein